jgi:hypothetical protein
MARGNPTNDGCQQLADEIKARRNAARSIEEARKVVVFGEESLRKCPTSYAVRSALAFSIFKAEIQLSPDRPDGDGKALTTAVERIRELMAHGPYHRTSAFVPALSAAVRKLSNSGNPALRREAIRLVKSVEINEVNRDRSGIFPSHAETFFAAAAKALAADAQYRDDLVKICRLALEPGVFADLKNSAWIRFWLARAIENDNPEEALALLDGLPEGAREDGMESLFVRLLHGAGRDEEALTMATGHVKRTDFGKLEYAHPLMITLMELMADGPTRTQLVVFLQHFGRNKRARGVDPKVVAVASALGLPEPETMTDAQLVVMFADLKSDL